MADPSVVSPDGYSLDDYFMTRAGAHEAQLDLFLDYASNVALYPEFQAYFRTHQPPLLAVWGNKDPFSCRKERRPISATFPKRKFISTTPGISPSKATWREIAPVIAQFLERVVPRKG